MITDPDATEAQPQAYFEAALATLAECGIEVDEPQLWPTGAGPPVTPMVTGTT